MSPFWQWFFAIIGLVAFLMATPYVLQLLFGQPDIGYSFYEDDSGKEGKLIQVTLMNPPVEGKLFQFLKVLRMPAQDVFLTAHVFNASTKKAIGDPVLMEIATSNTTKNGRVSIPPSIMVVKSTIAKWQRSSNSAVLIYGRELKPLPEGSYLVAMEIGLDGRMMKCRKLGLLHVGKTEPELKWDESITHSLYS
jgi:hypothetical protein